MEETSQKKDGEAVGIADFSKENLQLLLDTIEGINHTKEFKTVLMESLEAARIVMNSEASSLMLMDQDTGELYVRIPTGPVKQEIAGKSIPKFKGISGWVARNRKPYMTNDVSQSEHFYGELAEGFTTKNLICVPLINRENEVVGVIQALNRRNNKEFNAHDIPVFQALAAHVTIAIERTRYIDYLHVRLKEKDIISTEMNHRIKNNLIALKTMLTIEVSKLSDETAIQVFKDMERRVESMYQLHEMLVENNLGKTVELDHYLKQISEKIYESMSSILSDAVIEFKGDSIQVSQEQALRCGLIVNELLINIYKHAFSQEDEEGKIDITLVQNDDSVKLRVSDNGVGLPEDFKFGKGDSVGMWIVEELLDKMGGEISIERNEGTRFTILFPLK